MKHKKNKHPEVCGKCNQVTYYGLSENRHCFDCQQEIYEKKEKERLFREQFNSGTVDDKIDLIVDILVDLKKENDTIRELLNKEIEEVNESIRRSAREIYGYDN
jgi:hypothetical protein